MVQTFRENFLRLPRGLLRDDTSVIEETLVGLPEDSGESTLPLNLYVSTTCEELKQMIKQHEHSKPYCVLLCRVIVSSDPLSKAAHWLKQTSPTQTRGVKAHCYEYIYPEYLMLCKLVPDISDRYE